MQFALKSPAWDSAKSVYISVLNKSAAKLPKFVSSVLILENLASNSIPVHPTYYSSL